MNAMILAATFVGSLVTAEASGPVSRIPDASQGVPGCLLLGDLYTIHVDADTLGGQILSVTASGSVNGQSDGAASPHFVSDTAFPDNVASGRGYLQAKYDRTAGGMAKATFPLPSLIHWAWMPDNTGTNIYCQVDISPITWDVSEYLAGDANTDGVFDSDDMVQVFAAGEYEDRFIYNSDWATGDWNFDNDFNSSDLVLAMSTGQYESSGAAAVPEPSSMTWIALAVLLWIALKIYYQKA